MTDPRIAVLAALSSPDWHPVPEAHGMPWGEAEALLAAYDAARDAVSSAGPVPAADRADLRKQIIEALYAARRPGLGGMSEAEAVAYMADAVLAVLPANVDRAAVLREAADALDADMERFFAKYPEEPRNSPYALGGKDAAAELRRMADEAPQPETEAQPSGTRQCGHDDYHDAHEWADRPDVWCPGHSYDDEPAVGAQQPKEPS